jgi:hypothetical protein
MRKLVALLLAAGAFLAPNVAQAHHHHLPPPTCSGGGGVGFAFGYPGTAGFTCPGYNSNTAVMLTSPPSTTTQSYGAVYFPVPLNADRTAGTMTLDQLTTLSTEYEMTQGSCGGSPRFQIALSAPGTPGAFGYNMFVYLSYNCPLNVWTNTGNLLSPTSVVDDSQFPGGSGYDTAAGAQAKYGNWLVYSMFLGMDDGHGNIGIFDNTQINAHLYTYEPGS